MPVAKLVSTGVAARLLGVDPRTLTRWVTAGHLRPHRTTVGGHYRWDLKRVEKEYNELVGEDRQPSEADPSDES